MSYRTVTGPGCAQITISRSIFIARAREVHDESAVRTFLAEAKAADPTADHHCYAYRILSGTAEITHSNDGGEPAGSAGRPILGVLLSAGLHNTAIIVTRYFGGKKLGLPGLSEAYRNAAAAVLAKVGTVERIPRSYLELRLPYDLLERARSLLRRYGAEEIRAEYGADVFLELAVPLEESSELAAALADMGLFAAARDAGSS